MSTKPCPFCGGTDVKVIEGSTFRWRLAQCQGCGAQAGDVRIVTTGDGTREEREAGAARRALEEWNKRPAAAALTDAQLLAIAREVAGGTSVKLTRDVGPYEVTEPTDVYRRIARAIESAHGIGGAA